MSVKLQLKYSDVNVALVILRHIYFILYRYVCISCARGQDDWKSTKIDDKVVVITGASDGLGKMSAIELAGRGEMERVTSCVVYIHTLLY